MKNKEDFSEYDYDLMCEILNEHYLLEKEKEEAIQKINEEALKFVKENISYSFDYIEEILEGNNYWKSEGYTTVEISHYKCSAYPNHTFYVETNIEKSLQYMRQDDNDEDDYHNLVWQTDGYFGDDYSGYLLFPLSNGYNQYWKISYSC